MNLSGSDLHTLEKQVSKVLFDFNSYIVSQWSAKQNITFKDKRDIATQTDIELERKLVDTLSHLLPDAGFITEEAQSQIKSEYNWSIDPIDGTKNFAYASPFFFTQVALLHKTTPILGVVFNPVSKQLFSASLSNGARLNNVQIDYTYNRSLSESLIDFDIGRVEKWKMDVISSIANKCYRIRSTGGFMAPYLLTGAIDCIVNLVIKNFSLSQNPKTIADIAPHAVLLSEAGIDTSFITLPDGNSVYIAAHKKLFNEIQSFL